ncbi:MAG: DUF1295 domain-containing protein [Candidatus Bathyarchaeota archaeon]|nr:DUF1295 domain-containing protein [Candidatus Bathyarchaeota archaeon]
MADSTPKENIRHILEVILTAVLFGSQTILNAGVFISVMSIPLLPYLYAFLVGQYSIDAFLWNIQVMLFSKMFWVGRIIAVIGVVLLVVSAAQLLWSRHKGVRIINTGLYAVVRHPQFTGIIVVTVGLTVMVLTNDLNGYVQLAGLWLIQALGYIGIARYEEWRLSRKYKEEYQRYQRKVPFLFPVKNPAWFPELMFTILIAALISVVLGVFPYQLIRFT